ncbi:MAG: hypothetical protein H5T75_08490 [Coriobacteriia bacterium]|nr:hypothetical protein [Coriobacteriia bacterium]
MDPRLYILGGLAFLSVVAVLYLVAAVVGYVSGAARARRRQAVAYPSGEVEAVPEPIVPGGPPPVLDADPFAASDAREPGSETRGEAAADAFEPAATDEAASSEPSVQLSPAIPEARPEEPSAVTAASSPTHETERIAALLASLQEQAERELASAQAPLSVAPSAISEQPADAFSPAAVVAPASAVPPAAAVAPASAVSAAAAGSPAPAASAAAAGPPSVATAPASIPSPAPAAMVPAEAVARFDRKDAPATPAPAPEYNLVAPVELHFTQGSGRIGVRPGTRTHDEFQRLANALLSELKQAQSRARQ